MTSPASMTYASLVSDVLKYSERPNDAALTAQIPRIIMLAETECASDLKVLGNEIVAEANFTPGIPYVAKPSFWRKTSSIMITKLDGTRGELQKRTYEYLRNFWPDSAETGVPRFYAEYNYNNFIVAPTPATDLDFEIIYNARLDPLSASNQVNWFTENAPQVLLYSCMYHTSLFLKNFDKADNWKAQYATALGSLMGEDKQRDTDRTTVKS